ncbi:hypothetical protein BC826DRAFT_1075715 [Russula brevipes]|nr:hypothetical protein BC826DRAFT_1075715 [Russula brevipes]
MSREGCAWSGRVMLAVLGRRRWRGWGGCDRGAAGDRVSERTQGRAEVSRVSRARCEERALPAVPVRTMRWEALLPRVLLVSLQRVPSRRRPSARAHGSSPWFALAPRCTDCRQDCVLGFTNKGMCVMEKRSKSGGRAAVRQEEEGKCRAERWGRVTDDKRKTDGDG